VVELIGQGFGEILRFRLELLSPQAVKTKLPAIQDAIENAIPGSFHFVDCGDPGE
jgi:hypothetical protein